jgi:hypothetical protein
MKLTQSIIGMDCQVINRVQHPWPASGSFHVTIARLSAPFHRSTACLMRTRATKAFANCLQKALIAFDELIKSALAFKYRLFCVAL